MRDAADDMTDASDSKVEPRNALQAKAEPVQAPAAPEPVKLTPAQWAEKLGHMRRADPRIPQSVTHADWQHAAADRLYGWAKHAYNFQTQPFLLSQADYELALEAAAQYPLKAPHAAALPASQADRFEGFRPRAGKEKV